MAPIETGEPRAGALSVHHQPHGFSALQTLPERPPEDAWKSRLLRCIQASEAKKRRSDFDENAGFQTHLCGAPVIKNPLLIPALPDIRLGIQLFEILIIVDVSGDVIQDDLVLHLQIGMRILLVVDGIVAVPGDTSSWSRTR